MNQDELRWINSALCESNGWSTSHSDLGAGSTDAASVRGSAKAGWTICDRLVVWTIWIIFPSIGNHTNNHPNWRNHIFRGGSTTDQITPCLNMKCFPFSILWMFPYLPVRCHATKSSFGFWLDNFACFPMRPSLDLWSSTFCRSFDPYTDTLLSMLSAKESQT